MDVLRDVVKSLYQEDFVLRHEQKDAVLSVLCRRDTLVVLPTCFGKSLVCNVIPRVMDELRRPLEPNARSIVLVVSPLIALMEDQVGRLTGLGLSGARWHPGLTDANRIHFEQGDYEIVFVSPESLELPPCRKLLSSPFYQRNVKCIAVDEAHCVPNW